MSWLSNEVANFTAFFTFEDVEWNVNHDGKRWMNQDLLWGEDPDGMLSEDERDSKIGEAKIQPLLDSFKFQIFSAGSTSFLPSIGFTSITSSGTLCSTQAMRTRIFDQVCRWVLLSGCSTGYGYHQQIHCSLSFIITINSSISLLHQINWPQETEWKTLIETTYLYHLDPLVCADLVLDPLPATTTTKFHCFVVLLVYQFH